MEDCVTWLCYLIIHDATTAGKLGRTCSESTALVLLVRTHACAHMYATCMDRVTSLVLASDLGCRFSSQQCLHWPLYSVLLPACIWHTGEVLLRCVLLGRCMSCELAAFQSSGLTLQYVHYSCILVWIALIQLVDCRNDGVHGPWILGLVCCFWSLNSRSGVMVALEILKIRHELQQHCWPCHAQRHPKMLLQSVRHCPN